MISAILSPLIFWPLISLAFLYSLFGATTMLPLYLVTSIPVIHLSNLIFLRGYDMWTDFGDARRRKSLASSPAGIRLEELVLHLSPRLGVLK